VTRRVAPRRLRPQMSHHSSRCTGTAQMERSATRGSS
jgi:hypothetical protein